MSGGSRRARAARTAAGAASPPVLTGGEETQRAVVDWLTVTWLPEWSDVHVARELWDSLKAWLGLDLVGQECPGRYGFAFGCQYSAMVYGTLVPIGRVDWGGDMRKGRARLDLSGSGCSKVNDWRPVHAWVSRQVEPTITRCDLAVDFLLGEFTVNDAVDWYTAGQFRVDDSGMQPRHSMPGDWINPAYEEGTGKRWGRTLEVGRRENGKMARVYEKGRQLGDSASDWTRFEVEYRNNDRDIPLDILLDRDAYFAGAYRCCAQVLNVAGERIKTHQAEGEVTLARAVQHTRTSYGQVVNVLRLKLGAQEVLDLIAREGVPRRLHKPSLTAFHTFGAGALSDREVSA